MHGPISKHDLESQIARLKRRLRGSVASTHDPPAPTPHTSTFASSPSPEPPSPRELRPDAFIDTAAAFHALVEGIREGAAILAVDRTVLTCNHRLAEMLKLECAAVMGRSMLEFIPPEDQTRFEELLQSASDDFRKLHLRLSGANAFPLPVELAVKSLTAGDERLFSLLATDLSRRRRAEEQLAFQAHLLSNVSDAILAMDDHFRITYWNPGAQRLYGWTADDVLGRTVSEVTHPQLSADEQRDLNRRLAETGAFDSKSFHRRKDGTSIWVESRRMALRAPDGHMTGYVSVDRDLTESKKAEEQLAYQAGLLSRVHDAIVATDDCFKITYWSPIAAETFGWTAEEALGQYTGELLQTQVLGSTRDRAVQQLIVGGHYEGEVRYRRKDGTYFVAHVRSAALKGSRGEFRGLVTSVRDITERKTSEERIRTLNAELEQRVEERTRELENERARWQGMVDGIADEVWVCDLQGRMSLTNLPEVTAMGLAEFRDKTLSQVYEMVDILTPDGQMRPMEQTPLLRSLRGEVVRGEEIMRHRRTGETRYRQFSSAPTRDAAGQITGAVAIIRDITDLKTAEAGVESMARFPAENPDPILRLSASGAILYANDASAGILQQWHAPLGGAAPQFWQEIVTQALASGEHQTVECDVKDRTYSIIVVPVPSAAYVNLYARDITDRKRAEAQLKEREELFRLAVTAGRAGAWGWDLRSHTVQWSDEYYRLFGFEPGRIPPSAEAGISRVHPEDRARVEAVIREAVERGTPIDHVHRVVWPDGTVHWLRGIAQMFFDDQGRPERLAGLSLDITERKQIEDALRQSEEKYRTLFASVREGFTLNRALYDETGRLADFLVLDANLAAEQASGLTREAFVGKTWRELWPGGEQYWWDVCSRVIRNGEQVVYENYAAVHDRWYEVRQFPAGQDLIGSLFTDITERKQKEQEIQRLTQDLKQRAADLEGANQELEAFSYSVSHDLRTPLGSIDGFSRALAEDYGSQLPEDGQRFIDLIHQNVLAMNRLIDDLLMFSRTARQPLVKQTVDMTALVRRVLQELGDTYAGRQVEVLLGDLPAAHADPTLLKQVWVNLLSNALKYTRRRAVARIEIGSYEKEGETIYVIRDNGVGFDPAQAEKLFRVFQRLHPEEDYEGTGVGLAIVERIIRRHGGNVVAEAQVDRGATFYFTLA